MNNTINATGDLWNFAGDRLRTEIEMAIRDSSLLAFEKAKKILEPDQRAVMEIIEELGPVCDKRILEALQQKESKKPKELRRKRKWSINKVTPRRGEMVEFGFVRDLGMHRGRFKDEKTTCHLWRARDDKREPVGWEKMPDEGRAIDRGPQAAAERREKAQQVKEQAGRKVLVAMNNREQGPGAGNRQPVTGIEYRKHKTRKLTMATKQSTFAFG